MRARRGAGTEGGHHARRADRRRGTGGFFGGRLVRVGRDVTFLARGEFVVLLDHDDLLAPWVLGAIAEAVVAESLVDLVYSDEDKLSADGIRRSAPFFKPDR